MASIDHGPSVLGPRTDTKPPRLCAVCKHLDIRRLLLASAKSSSGRNETMSDRANARTVEKSPDLFFRQHATLLALKSHSEHCDLCLSIWTLFCTKIGGPACFSDEELNPEHESQTSPIYLTCNPTDNAWNKFASVVAFQKGSNDSTRLLCSFDLFADRGAMERVTRLVGSHLSILSRLATPRSKPSIITLGLPILGLDVQPPDDF